MREVRARAANADPLSLAEFPVHDDAGNALQRFGEVLVRKLADVFGGERIDNADCLALGLERLAQTAANTGDDHFIDSLRYHRLRE